MEEGFKARCGLCACRLTSEDRYHYRTHCERCEHDGCWVRQERAAAVKSPGWALRCCLFYLRRVKHARLTPALRAMHRWPWP